MLGNHTLHTPQGKLRGMLVLCKHPKTNRLQGSRQHR